MFLSISVPDEAVKYILLQRTGYIMLDKNRLIRKLANRRPDLVYGAIIALEASIRKNRVKQLFNEDMLGEYQEIKAWLPSDVSAVLDIGCGVGGIDVLLYRHYDCDPNIDFYLLDKTSIDRTVFYGFRSEGSFYSSLEVTELMLRQNGLSRESIHTLEATSDCRINVGTVVDLVISLIAWGFHFPVCTYIDRVHDILRESGHLIMDVRKGTEGEAELRRKFAQVGVIGEAQKRIRVLAVK